VTVGVEFASKVLLVEPNVRVRLQIWDTVIMNKNRQDRNSLGPLCDLFIKEFQQYFWCTPSIMSKVLDK
jgi:hypothetical protein